MRARYAVILGLSCGVLHGLDLLGPCRADAQSCDTVAIGVALANADTTVEPFYCRGWGQVFVASDSLIKSISIWRPAIPALDGQPRSLFITEMDPRGFPDIRRIVLSGPSLVVQAGDGVNPVEYRFAFDPPFTLPHRGTFFFDILTDRYGAFRILASKSDVYKAGRGWLTGVVFECDRPGPLYSDSPEFDLAFRIDFCKGVEVASEQGSWGAIKMHYR